MTTSSVGSEFLFRLWWLSETLDTDVRIHSSSRIIGHGLNRCQGQSQTALGIFCSSEGPEKSESATLKRRDAQLEAAVKHLQELIAKDPVEVPKHPPYPDKKK